MSAPVSVIVPTLHAADRLGPTLGALGEAVFDGLIREVILVDGGSDDGIATVAEAVGARLLTVPPGRGGQLGAGARAATGEWLLFLHADTVLSPGWALAARRHIELAPDRAGYFDLRFDAGGLMARWTAGWANLRSRALALPYGDQGLLVSRVLYERAGGYDEIPLMEDVALARRLGRGRLAPLGAVAVTSARRYRQRGWLRQGARNLTTLALYFLGTAPEKLARRYRR
ncbi:MAG: TIGR04283 family arsenosugar biosynthesis glycosyltransferase [Pseudomonadota bacterium]